MHCKNPLCYEDSCNGECVKEEERFVKETESLEWPWYRYENTQIIEVKEEPKPL